MRMLVWERLLRISTSWWICTSNCFSIRSMLTRHHATSTPSSSSYALKTVLKAPWPSTWLNCTGRESGGRAEGERRAAAQRGGQREAEALTSRTESAEPTPTHRKWAVQPCSATAARAAAPATAGEHGGARGREAVAAREWDGHQRTLA